MQSLDEYVLSLTEQSRKDLNPKVNTEGNKAYEFMAARYSKRKLVSAIKKHGSVEAMRYELKAEKKTFYDKYGRTRGIRLAARRIMYVRYANDFLVGIVGPKEFALGTRNKINTFLKSNLHLEVKKDALVNRNEKGINFLSFVICMPSFNKKTRTKWAKSEALSRYRRRISSKLMMSDARAAKSAAFAIKSNLILTFRQYLSKMNLINYNKGNVTSVTNRIMKEVIEGCSVKATVSAPNPAMERWVMHFSELFKKDAKLAVLYYLKYIKNIPGPKLPELEIATKLQKLRENFINGLNDINKRLESFYFEENRSDILTIKEENKEEISLKSSYDEATLSRAADVLTTEFLIQTKARRISINAPIKNIVEKLRGRGFIHSSKNRAQPLVQAAMLTDHEIVFMYNSLIDGLLRLYAGSDNFAKVRSIAMMLKKSCAMSIGSKHKKGLEWVYSNYNGINLKVKLSEKKEIGLISNQASRGP